MTTDGEKQVGRFAVPFTVANDADIVLAQGKKIAAGKVRRTKISGVVDCGGARLVLPGSVVKELGLPITRKVKVKYADGRVRMRDWADRVHVELLGRYGTFSAIVEPKRRTALIGAIVLEELDFLVDSTHQRLVPRDPRFVVSEIE